MSSVTIRNDGEPLDTRTPSVTQTTYREDNHVGFFSYLRATSQRELRAMLKGRIPFPCEPNDVTAAERGALWEETIRAHPSWSSLLYWYGGGMSRIVAMTSVFVGFTIWRVCANWFPETHVSALHVLFFATVSIFGWGIMGKFSNSFLARVSTKGTDVLYRFHRVLRKMTGRNLNMHPLLEIQLEWGDRHHGNPILHDALGMARDNLDFPKRLGAADLVALMRLTERLKVALPLISAGVRVDIDGEAEELLHRVCEACGMQPHEMLRVRQDGLRV